jgi:hypothetical protein
MSRHPHQQQLQLVMFQILHMVINNQLNPAMVVGTNNLSGDLF